MAQSLWTLPVPSTALLSEVKFQVLPSRACALLCEYEDENDNVVSVKIHFGGVEAFKCTYHTACSVQMIDLAYDRVVDLGVSDWSTEIRTKLVSSGKDVSELRHLIIYFDDGPCYEFICCSFKVEEK